MVRRRGRRRGRRATARDRDPRLGTDASRGRCAVRRRRAADPRGLGGGRLARAGHRRGSRVRADRLRADAVLPVARPGVARAHGPRRLCRPVRGRSRGDPREGRGPPCRVCPVEADGRDVRAARPARSLPVRPRRGRRGTGWHVRRVHDGLARPRGVARLLRASRDAPGPPAPRSWQGGQHLCAAPTPGRRRARGGGLLDGWERRDPTRSTAPSASDRSPLHRRYAAPGLQSAR